MNSVPANIGDGKQIRETAMAVIPIFATFVKRFGIALNCGIAGAIGNPPARIA